MATQESILKFKGRIGDLSFYKTKDGYAVRGRGGVSGARIKDDPRYQRTRENGLEFGRAGQSAKVLRNALRAFLETAKDRTSSNRLMQQMMKVTKTDPANLRGERTVTGGDITLLNGFDFNAGAPLAKTIFAQYTSSIDRATGSLSVDMPAFTPAHHILKVPEATHMTLVIIGVEVDFVAGKHAVAFSESELIPMGPQEVAATRLAASLPPQSDLPLFLIFGVQFTQLLNGTQYPLNNGAYNALAIVSAAKV
jgi:hypothetical protein